MVINKEQLASGHWYCKKKKVYIRMYFSKIKSLKVTDMVTIKRSIRDCAHIS